MPPIKNNPPFEQPDRSTLERIEPLTAEAPVEALSSQSPEPPRTRLGSVAHAAKRAAQSAIVTAEVLPITNEGSRYGALFATELISRNPALGAVVLGGSTFIVEGAGALAASELLTSSTSSRILNFINRRSDRYISPDAKMSMGVETGIAMTLGTPALLLAQQRQNPSRTSVEARKQGLLTASWMAGVFAVEGALISEGILQAPTLPEKIGAGILITAGLASLPNWAKKAVRHWKAEKPNTENFVRVKDSISGVVLTPEQVDESSALYEAFRDSQDEALKIGLYGEDLQAAYKNPRAVLLEYQTTKNKTSYAPLLVPAEDLVWYNLELLKRTYGYAKEFYYYTHPPVPQDEQSQAVVTAAIRQKLDAGAVIFTDQYASQPHGILGDVADSQSYVMENLGGGNQLRTGEVFEAVVSFDGVQEVQNAPSLFDVYHLAVETGEISVDPRNGVALAETIEGKDAKRIWQIYKDPFDRLSYDHPMAAGFDEKALLDILADPKIAKIVNRVDGEITTLCFFVQDFDHCPWFNKRYYQERYPEFFNTSNIVIFPGVVTDDKARGSSYSLPVMNLATRLYAKRGSNMLMTFECTETSAGYIPGIVNFAINHSGVATMEPIGDPVSVTEYKALRRVS